MALVEFQNVIKDYFQPYTRVLENVHWQVDAEKMVAIMGPSGSGKSTILRLIAGLEAPTEGHVFCNGCEPSKLDTTETSQFRQNIIGFIFQLHHLLPQCTVLENILVPELAEKNNVSPAILAKAITLLEHIGLSHHANTNIQTLSGGERQRVAVARALIRSPKIILADEPTGSLDQKTGEQVVDMLIKLCRTNKQTLILVTHDTNIASKMDMIWHVGSGQVQS